MIDIGEVFANIALENVGAGARKLGEAAERFMGAEVLAIGVGVGDECFLKNRRDQITKGVVNNSVSIGGRRNITGFGIDDFEDGVGAGAVGLLG